jgi:two-component system, OmpR family, response regulator RegX3
VSAEGLEGSGAARRVGPSDGRTILVVERPDAEPSVARGLVIDVFDVVVVDRAHDALDLLDEVDPDVVVVDFELPGLAGVDLCRELRRRSDLPIVVVGDHDDDGDAVLSLEVGADDFVSQRHSERELVARLRALIRRQERAIAPIRAESDKLRVGDIRLDRRRHEAFLAGGRLSLAPKEFALLAVLLEHAGAVVTRQELLHRAWGPDFVGDTKTLDTHIKRLRAKIERDASATPRIVTVRGIGFRFERPVDEPSVPPGRVSVHPTA